MTAAGYVTAGLGAWLIFATCMALPIGKAMSRADRTQPAAYPPPVPPSKPREDDSLWLEIWPDAADEQAAIDSEFHFMITSEYGETAL